MKFTVYDFPQRSPEWFDVRCGVATGSRAPDIVAKIKSGEAAAKRNYITQLAVERVTRQPQDEPIVTVDTSRGIELEPEAIMAYEAATGTLVEQTGFLKSTEIQAGCSLDGSLDSYKGIIEIKCPRPTTAVQWIRDGKLPARHVAQVTHNLLICDEALWCDFVCYCPALPANLSLFIVRVTRDELDLDGYAQELNDFLAAVDEQEQFLLNWRKQ